MRYLTTVRLLTRVMMRLAPRRRQMALTSGVWPGR